MRVIDPQKLSALKSFDIDALFAMKQVWREGQSFLMSAPRKQSALLWFCGSSGRFLLKNGHIIDVPYDSLVLIPEGGEYEITFSSCGKPSAVLLEFCLSVDGIPFSLFESIYVPEKKAADLQIKKLLLQFCSEYAKPEKSYLSLKSLFYQILHLLALREEQSALNSRRFRTIEPGIRYLETNEEQALSIDEIAALCYVSTAYFRRLFREYCGVSPIEYRTARKIERARELLLRSELSIAEISDLLGYEDPSYFCRAFKREAGIAPTLYRKMPMQE